MCYPSSTLVTVEELAKRRRCHVLRAAPVAEAAAAGGGGGILKQCVCSPTSHPGSFRCRHHQAEYVWGGRVIQASTPNNNIYTFKVVQREG